METMLRSSCDVILNYTRRMEPAPVVILKNLTERSGCVSIYFFQQMSIRRSNACNGEICFLVKGIILNLLGRITISDGC